MPWPCSTTKYISHFPETREIWSYGSGYRSNALLGKKCYALRVASVMARDEGWLAEHMLIIKVTPQAGDADLLAAAFPSACGKTNLAMLQPVIPGWRVETIGDDMAWLRFGGDGRLYAINPEAGFFGVAPGTSAATNANAIATLRGNSIFTNVALTDDGDVWWEGLTRSAACSPDRLEGTRLDSRLAGTRRPPQFPVHRPRLPVPGHRSRMGQSPASRSRRSCSAGAAPLPFRWSPRLSTGNAASFGATIASERTAAADGNVGELRRDPFAMLPFAATTWVTTSPTSWDRPVGSRKLPRIYFVNWFRKEPPAGSCGRASARTAVSSRSWIIERLSGDAQAAVSPIGKIPTRDALE